MNKVGGGAEVVHGAEMTAGKTALKKQFSNLTATGWGFFLTGAEKSHWLEWRGVNRQLTDCVDS